MTQVTTTSNNKVSPAKKDIKSLLANDVIKNRFKEILGAKTPGFISSIINVVQGNTNLSQAEPNSIIMAAAQAATLDLPINPNLGFAYIIPYKESWKETDNEGKDVWKSVQIAQFQIGYKGIIQLAKRSGQYLKINAVEVRAGQLKKSNHLTEEFEFDFEVGHDDEIIGFVAYFKELNGFEKVVYWNVKKMNDHAKKHSKAFGKASSPWTTDYVAMGKKTIIKEALSKYGTLSIEMQHANKVDQAVVKNFEGTELNYVDSNTVDAEHTDVTSLSNSENNQEHTSEKTAEVKETVKAINVPDADNL